MQNLWESITIKYGKSVQEITQYDDEYSNDHKDKTKLCKVICLMRNTFSPCYSLDTLSI
jgi:hypothetical protein